ncbi:uncharacterized protein K02A2.6-like [Gigantopelta aegis]|uniref:uncharacterized protein K02A2.6-like n=1 Tax=Gigantopelta aegis TaxID=1735272 RepID=UPI001B88E004|nr:uncharacterized protein K02A2.6-like [Gigantopelta aegis]
MQQPSRKFNSKTRVLQDEGEEEECYSMYTLDGKKKASSQIQESFIIQGQKIDMEIYTGASVSVINEDTFRLLKINSPLRKSKAILLTFTGEKIIPLGVIDVSVQYQNQEKTLPLLVVAHGPTLMGRNWLHEIRLNWGKIQNKFGINKVSSTNHTALNELLQKYDHLFKDELGALTGKKATIYLKEGVTPVFMKSRPVPYALREGIEVELEQSEAQGTIKPVEFSDWATPIVPVVKSDSTVRIYGDYKMTINKACKVDSYPIPKVDDLYAKLGGGQKYTELDLSHAYELLLDDVSSEYVTINTHRVLYHYQCLPYGVSSSPGIFQCTMECLFHNIPNFVAYLDNLIITGSNDDEHLENVSKVLEKLSQSGLRLKRSKCQFMAEKMMVLGHVIREQGIQPCEAKVKAVHDAPVPTNITELKAYLGLVNYYHRYLPNLSSMLAPLYDLLKKNMVWRWSSKQQQVFDSYKRLLCSDTLLVHYDLEKKMILSCNTSPYGVGAVLSHVMENGDERPIGYASRTLAPAEKNYSQLDKEGLAMIFGVKKFYQYLYGRSFKITTDHKPLLGLLGENKGIPSMASARLQRWALTLAAYDYHLEYKSGKENENSDALSRLQLPYFPETVPLLGEEILMLERLESTPLDAKQIKMWTRSDPVLSKVLLYTQKGWPKICTHDELQSYFRRKDEISTQDGCLLWGSRIIVPPQGRERVLKELHTTLPGMTKMKGMARSLIWWPKMDQEIEETVRLCHTCQLNQKSPPKSPLHPWEWPERPWSRIHVDHAGPFHNHLYLVAHNCGCSF